MYLKSQVQCSVLGGSKRCVKVQVRRACLHAGAIFGTRHSTITACICMCAHGRTYKTMICESAVLLPSL